VVESSFVKLIDASNKRSLAKVFAVNRGEDRAFERRVASIVDRVREQGDPALVRFARTFDDMRPPLEVSRHADSSARRSAASGGSLRWQATRTLHSIRGSRCSTVSRRSDLPVPRPP
jgi:histidinol dehydrogenase